LIFINLLTLYVNTTPSPFMTLKNNIIYDKN